MDELSLSLRNENHISHLGFCLSPNFISENEDKGSDGPLNRTRPDLWDQALQKLDPVDKQRISSNRVDQRAVLGDLLKLVTEKQRVSVERQWKYTKRNGEVILIRDAIQKVVHWVKKFREVGDSVAQYDPAHMSLPWAGIRLLLQLAINDSETYGAMIEGVELVSSLITQYAKVEELYFHTILAQQEQLEKSMTELYAAILTYLSKAIQYYGEGRAGRMAKNLVLGSSSVNKYTNIIVDRAAQVDVVARIIDVDFTRKILRFMYGEFQGVHARFDGLENKLDGLQLSFRAPFTKPTMGLEQILTWLNPVFTEEEYETALRSQIAGTCQWLFQRAQFQEWKFPSQNVKHPHKTFWVHGPPGFGKTVLCANVIRRLQDDYPGRVAYFFCTSDDAIKRQPLAIVRSLVAQMIRHHPVALDIAESVYQGKGGQPPTTQDVWLMFGDICRSITNCFFIVDGFDECVKTTRNAKFLAYDEGARFLRDFSRASTPTSAHILFVSREDIDIRGHFRRLVGSNPDGVVEYEISPKDTQLDLQAYSESVVSDSLSKKPIELQAEIAEEATQRSQGMFLWIRLLGSRLSGGKNAKKLREIIKKTPAGLEMQYERDVQRIEKLGDERERAIAILRWTLFARRPLTVRELTEALAIDLDDDRNAFPKDGLPDTWEEDEVNDEIRRLCGSLIELRSENEGELPQNQTVHFVHSSVREYLMQSARYDPHQGTDLLFQAQEAEEDLLAQICLRYLMCEEFAYHLTKDDAMFHEIMDEYKFLEYAARSWYLHARSKTIWSSSLYLSAIQFFEPSAGRWILWSKIFTVGDVVNDENLTTPPQDLRPLSSLFFMSLLGLSNCVQHHLLVENEVQNVQQDTSTPLQAASATGNLEVVQLLIKHGAVVNTKDKESWTPLHFAARNGHLEVVKLLIEEKASVDAKYKDSWTPINSAADSGHLEVVKLLLENGADMTITTRKGFSPLHSAANKGHLEVVKLLLEEGADLAIINNDGWTPLNLATLRGHLEVVKMLLEKGADMVANKDGWTPLNSAANNGHLEVVKLLLEKGADLAVANKDGWTPLNSAANNDHIEVVKLLLEKGADMVANKYGWTPLNSAADSGHLEVVTLLLEKGADLAVVNKDGWTPLNSAANNGDIKVVKLLLEKGADMVVNKNGWTPLNSAADSGHLEVVKLLLEKGADLAVANKDEWTPLNSAANNGHIEVVKLLLEKGADMVIDKYGWTPLNSAADSGHLEVVKLLLEKGADLAVANKDGWTPLNSAANNGHIEVVKLLLEKGADLAVANKNGWTPLNSAVNEGHIKVVKLLLEEGADLAITSNDGWTPLNLATLRGHLEVVKMLLEKGADMVTNKYGWTPLNSAADSGHLEVVTLLLEKGADLAVANKNGWTPLNSAADSGHLEVVKLLLEKGADMTITTRKGFGPLHSAANKGHLEVVKLLLEEGADLAIISNDGWTPLDLATYHGHLEVIKLLLEEGADLAVISNDGWTPLNLAADSGHLEVVKMLLEKGADMVINNDGYTPLNSAANNGHLEVVKLLLEKGADLAVANKDGWTPLNSAANKGHIELVKLLLEKGADMVVNKNGWTPLNSAADSGHLEVVKLLLEKGADLAVVNKDGWTPLNSAANNGHIEVVKLLLEKGADMVINKYGWTPLNSAADSGHLEVVKLLLEKGADLAVANKDGWTPLNSAANKGHIEVVELLLEKGVDVAIANQKGWTPLYVAANKCHIEADQASDKILITEDAVKAAARNSRNGKEVMTLLLDRAGDKIPITEDMVKAAAGNSVNGKEVMSSLLRRVGTGPPTERVANLKSADFCLLAPVLWSFLDDFNFAVIERILQHTAETYVAYNMFQELLCLSAEKQAPESITEFFLQHGTSWTAPGIYEWTPSMCAKVSKRISLRTDQQSSISQQYAGLPKPGKWHSITNQRYFDFSDDDREAVVRDDVPELSLRERIQLRANHFMPADCDHFYFEVTFITVGPEKFIGIGFCHLDCPLSGMPGWESGSWGYHGDDGKIFWNGQDAEYGPTYGVEDVVGCGVDFTNNSAFFTKNGRYLGEAFSDLRGRLLPMCGVGEGKTKLRVNFGDHPFAYRDTESL